MMGNNLKFFPDVLAYQTQDSSFMKVLKKIYIVGQNVYYIRYQPGISHLRKFAIFLLLPVMSGAKTARIVFRHLRYQNWKNKFRTLLITPLLLLGGMYWMTGFYNALLSERGISKDR